MSSAPDLSIVTPTRILLRPTLLSFKVNSRVCRFSELVKDPSTLLSTQPGKEDSYSPAAILYTMTTCHSLKLVSDEIIGDPLDAKMFEFTGWTFEEGGRIYEFVHDAGDGAIGKEDDEMGILNKDDRVQRGQYVTREGNERSGRPSVRPPVTEGLVKIYPRLGADEESGTTTPPNIRI